MRDIPGYEGLYAVTTCGKIWSHRRKKFLSPGGVPGNYYVIFLSDKDQNSKCWYVHRLVALTYIPNPDNLPCVNHKDEHKDHNWVGNLEWCTSKYNLNYGLSPEKRKRPVYCVELDKHFSSVTEAAKQLGVQASNISNCLNGRIEKTGGYHFR